MPGIGQGISAHEVVISVSQPDVCLMESLHVEAFDKHAAHVLQQEARGQGVVHAVENDRAEPVAGLNAQIVLGLAGDGHCFPIDSRTNQDLVPRRGSIHCVLDRGELRVGAVFAGV